jgi:septum formation inhibitor MinC
MPKKKYNLNQIIMMDQHLMGLAAYELSQGMKILPLTQDELIDFNRRINKQFVQFKKMIQLNECTFDELEQMVLRRHGAVPNPYANMSMDEVLEEISNEEDNKEQDDIESFLDYLIDSLQGGLNVGMLNVSKDDGSYSKFQSRPYNKTHNKGLGWDDIQMAKTPEEMYEELQRSKDFEDKMAEQEKFIEDQIKKEKKSNTPQKKTTSRKPSSPSAKNKVTPRKTNPKKKTDKTNAKPRKKRQSEDDTN